jgi:hypothetical protein
MLDTMGNVANRVENFPLRLAQVFLRCVALPLFREIDNVDADRGG